jgi:hypothetical protein
VRLALFLADEVIADVSITDGVITDVGITDVGIGGWRVTWRQG